MGFCLTFGMPPPGPVRLGRASLSHAPLLKKPEVIDTSESAVYVALANCVGRGRWYQCDDRRDAQRESHFGGTAWSLAFTLLFKHGLNSTGNG